MTCSTSIVHFNFSLNPEINLNSVDKSNFLSSKESSQNIFINCFNKEDNSLAGQLLNKDCKLRIIKNQEKTANEISPKKILQHKLNENLNPQVNNFNSNMNNGLSNGHDLNLDFDLSSNLIQQSNSNNSFSTPEFSNTAVSINPVSSVSSSCSNSIPFVNSSSVTMGLLNDKDNLSQNILFLKGNKIENGQKVDFNSDTQWTEIKSNLLDKVNILPQFNLNTLANDMKEDNDLKNATNCDLSTQTDKEQFSMSYFSTNDNDVVEDPIEMTEKFEMCEEFDSKQFEIENVQHVKDLLKSGLCSDEFSSRTSNISNQHYFLSNSLTTDSVPIESTSNDLSSEQLALHNHGKQLMRRTRRLQIQHTHKNLTKQMKLFVSSHQKLNSVNCQRFDIDFSKFINTPIDNTSQLKALLMKDFSPIKNDKLSIPESNSNVLFSNLIPSNVQQNLINLSSSTDLLRQKILSHKLIAHSSSNQTQVIDNFSQPQKVSPNSLHQNDLPSFAATFPFDFQNNFSYLNSQDKQPNLCNISQKTLSQESKDKISTTLDTLRYNLRHLEEKYDSDATESSSDEESCDEFEVYEDKLNATLTSTPVSHLPPTTSAPKNYIPVRNRSVWKWCTERSAIASRWYWLQAQISDLETKLRQQNDIFRHLRATKGSAVFGENEKTRRQFPSLSSINATNVNSNQQTSFSSSSSSPSILQYNTGNNTNISLSSTNINFPSQQSDTNEPQTLPEEEEEESSCMRTMPLVNIKKRKLVRSEQTLSMAVKKAAKHSSVQCSCNIYPSYVAPCVICNGRYSYMHSIDTEFMPYYERISLLDSSCHPVLCLPNDVPLGLHFMQFLKRESVNNKQVILRNKKKRSINNNQLSASDNNNQKSNKSKLSSNLLSKCKKKPDKTKKRRLSGESSKKSNRDRLSSGCSSRAESPIPSPSPSDASSNGPSITVHTPTTTSAPLHRRRRSEQHAFDINNIVIPYSIAAATRVERLQYKEIITPKWRINEEFSIPPPENVKREIDIDINNIEEEVSECAFELRHSRCEEAERQRIMSYYVGLTKSQNIRKGTSRVRFESKSESADQSSQDSCSSKVKSKANNDCNYERKRHSSISKSLNREDSLYEELHEIVAPFELRQFPLPDNLYDMMVQESNNDEEEEDALLSRCNSAAKNSNIDSTDDGTHVSNSIVSSPSNTDMDLNDDEGIRGHEEIGEEKDDPEWKPTKD